MIRFLITCHLEAFYFKTVHREGGGGEPFGKGIEEMHKIKLRKADKAETLNLCNVLNGHEISGWLRTGFSKSSKHQTWWGEEEKLNEPA